MHHIAAFCAVSIAAFTCSTGLSWAATLANGDTEDRFVIVTENGEREEVAIPAGKEIVFCNSGCFLSFPSGDIMALKGHEKIMIEQGRGRLISR